MRCRRSLKEGLSSVIIKVGIGRYAMQYTVLKYTKIEICSTSIRSYPRSTCLRPHSPPGHSNGLEHPKLDFRARRHSLTSVSHKLREPRSSVLPSVWKQAFQRRNKQFPTCWSICFPPVESAATSEGIVRRGSYKRARPNTRCLTTTSEEHEHTASLWLNRLLAHTTHPSDILYLSGSIHSTLHTKYG